MSVIISQDPSVIRQVQPSTMVARLTAVHLPAVGRKDTAFVFRLMARLIVSASVMNPDSDPQSPCYQAFACTCECTD
jgi:hypothetical protein